MLRGQVTAQQEYRQKIKYETQQTTAILTLSIALKSNYTFFGTISRNTSQGEAYIYIYIYIYIFKDPVVYKPLVIQSVLLSLIRMS